MQHWNDNSWQTAILIRIIREGEVENHRITLDTVNLEEETPLKPTTDVEMQEVIKRRRNRNNPGSRWITQQGQGLQVHPSPERVRRLVDFANVIKRTSHSPLHCRYKPDITVFLNSRKNITLLENYGSVSPLSMIGRPNSIEERNRREERHL